jgi:hypothetical protein
MQCIIFKIKDIMCLNHVKRMVPLILLPWILEISGSLFMISKQGVTVGTVAESIAAHEVKKEISKSSTLKKKKLLNPEKRNPND